MEHQILHKYHDDMGHLGVDKCIPTMMVTYWFPKMRQKMKEHISNCLKCIIFSPDGNKREMTLHPIPKGNVPFDTIHIDHVGPFEKTISGKKHILVITNAFTKFVKLYACKSVEAKDALKHVETYFGNYSAPKRIVSDRGTACTSNEFEERMRDLNIQHIRIATGAPRANGQVERFNWVITPMTAKLSPEPDRWEEVLNTVEFALNNTINRTTGNTPSKLLFGVDQRGQVVYPIRDFLESEDNYDLNGIRVEAGERIKNSQAYNSQYFNKRHKEPKKYNVGDYIVTNN